MFILLRSILKEEVDLILLLLMKDIFHKIINRYIENLVDLLWIIYPNIKYNSICEDLLLEFHSISDDYKGFDFGLLAYLI